MTRAGAPHGAAPRRGWVAWLPPAFVALLALEGVLVVWLGQRWGLWRTLGLLALSAVFGAWVAGRGGARAWRALAEAARTATAPARGMADAALVLLGGLLLLLPGFLSDLLALVVLLPVTRPLARRVLGRLLGGRHGGPPGGPPGGGDIIEGEIVE